MITASPVATRASNASSASCAADLGLQLAPSSSRGLAKRPNWITALGPVIRDPQSGPYRRTRMSVLTLGYSRKAAHLLTFQSSTRIWAELHEQAFRRLGGSTRTVVLDDLGDGSRTQDSQESKSPLPKPALVQQSATKTKELPIQAAEGHAGSRRVPRQV
jgi:hypothetical protein